MSDAEFERARARITSVVSLAYDVWNASERCSVAMAETTFAADETTTLIHFRCAKAIGPLKVDVRLFREEAFRHTHVAKIEVGGRTHTVAFLRGSSAFESDAGLLRQVFGFLTMGVWHLFLGIDHILFLLALLLVKMSLANIIKIITSFTIAHSITLALAALSVVEVSPKLVEPAIAASIVYVAAENIWRKNIRHRWILTFLFGLIHGFGFASVLREMALTNEGLAVSLVSFNVGVEIGQLVVVLLLYWPLKWIAAQSWNRRFVLGASTVVCLCGVYWFVDRVS
ncbi:MAG: HupE/UreJ family protein [Deltaproteobacteria bacterium]|nr:HupE/UreJ family protein [Deltaproteobacteria bacterium]